MERNPNHPTTQAMRGQWHKLCAAIMFKLGLKEITITEEDLNKLTKSEVTNVVVDPRNDTLVVSLVDDKEARRLAKQAGGLPV